MKVASVLSASVKNLNANYAFDWINGKKCAINHSVVHSPDYSMALPKGNMMENPTRNRNKYQSKNIGATNIMLHRNGSIRRANWASEFSDGIRRFWQNGWAYVEPSQARHFNSPILPSHITKRQTVISFKFPSRPFIRDKFGVDTNFSSLNPPQVFGHFQSFQSAM